MNSRLTQIILGAMLLVTTAAFSAEPGTRDVPSSIAKLSLPEPVPYLNPLRPKQTQYCVGNGVVAVVAEPDGKWNRMIGPGYSAGTNTRSGDKFVLSETIQLIVDGKSARVQVEMQRARKTGVFYGSGVVGDIRYQLIDSARFGDRWLSRLVLLENRSTNAPHDVVVQAQLRNATAALKDTNGIASGYRNGKLTVAFTDPAATASADGKSLTASVATLAPGGSHSVGIIHLAGDDSDADALAKIRSLDAVALAAQSIAAWQAWYDDVPASYKLERITDARARDLVEGGLSVLKANQSADGGFMATPAMYTMGYVRDGVMALRGLQAAGHFTEARQFIQWLEFQFQHSRKICNAWKLSAQLEPDGRTGGGFGRDDFEGTSQYVLTARDYFHGTADLDTLRAANASLQYCIDAQQKFAAENNYNLLFSGDETEICLAIPDQKTGITRRGKGCYSLPSAALFAGALEFYIEFLKATGADPSAHVNSLTQKPVDLPRELERVRAAIETTFWRTNAPGVAGGFHDSFRTITNQAWPKYPIVNFTLQPIYWGCPYTTGSRRQSDVDAMKRFYDAKTGFIQLFPGVDNGFCGHNLGFLLYDLVAVGDPLADEVHRALTRGPTHSWLGYWNEAYLADGTPSTDYNKNGDNGLRSMETGVNISAIARYWRLGEVGTPDVKAKEAK